MTQISTLPCGLISTVVLPNPRYAGPTSTTENEVKLGMKRPCEDFEDND